MNCVPAKIAVSAIHKIQNPPRSTDDDSGSNQRLLPLLKKLNLLVLADASKDRDTAKTERREQRMQGLMRLQGKFSSRGDDQSRNTRGRGGPDTCQGG